MSVAPAPAPTGGPRAARRWPPGLAGGLKALALLAAGALGLALLGAALTRQTSHFYLVFNLALAVIPLGLALALDPLLLRGRRRWAWAAGGAWLLFLPNALYLLTDFIHLSHTPRHWLWAHLVLLAWSSFTGLAAGLLSLRIVHLTVERLRGPRAAWTVVLVSAGLSGVGVALGRLQRWNSWDILRHPGRIVADALGHLVPGSNPIDAALPFGLGLFFALAYLLIHALTPPPELPTSGDAQRRTS